MVQTVQVLTFSKGIDYCKKDSLIMYYQGNIKMCENALLSSSIFLVVPWYALIQEIIRKPKNWVHSILDVKVRKSSFVNTVCPREIVPVFSYRVYNKTSVTSFMAFCVANWDLDQFVHALKSTYST